jgi:hypothetical protein
MKPAEALAALGATPDLLTPAEVHSLDTLGFVILHNVLAPEELQHCRVVMDALAASEGGAGPNGEEEPGTQRLSNLLEKDPLFERFISTPRVLAAIAHVAGTDIQLSSLSSRTALPRQEGGQDASQGFHRDWHDNGDGAEGRFAVCNSMWMIDAFTESNGSTRVVPASHLNNDPLQEVDGKVQAHPEEVTVCGPAGAVAVFNSHIYHAGGQNVSDGPRRGVLAYFGRRAAMHGPAWRGPDGEGPEGPDWVNGDGSSWRSKPGGSNRDGPQTGPELLSAATVQRLSRPSRVLAGLPAGGTGTGGGGVGAGSSSKL